MDDHVQTFTLAECPHCHQPVYFEQRLATPETVAVHTPVELLSVKQELIKILKEKGKAPDVVSWLEEETTIVTKEQADKIAQEYV